MIGVLLDSYDPSPPQRESIGSLIYRTIIQWLVSKIILLCLLGDLILGWVHLKLLCYHPLWVALQTDGLIPCLAVGSCALLVLTVIHIAPLRHGGTLKDSTLKYQLSSVHPIGRPTQQGPVTTDTLTTPPMNAVSSDSGYSHLNHAKGPS